MRRRHCWRMPTYRAESDSALQADASQALRQVAGPESGEVAAYTRCVATATQNAMKTATFPSLRVDAELREAAEGVLREGETLTGLIESAVRDTIHRRQAQAAFLARGLHASDEAKRTGVYHAASVVHDELQRRLDTRRKQVLGEGRLRGSLHRDRS